MMNFAGIFLGALLLAGCAWADDDKAKAAIGGGAGGAIGAVIGDEVGGRNGAIIGAGVGAATGAAIATDGDQGAHRHHRRDDYAEVHGHGSIPEGHMPPPGKCRIWYPGEPPGQQPPPGSCRKLKREVPRGAWLVRG